jgi:hypothetical protein
MPDVPAPLIKNVFGNEHARALLLLLEGSRTPIRYSHAREQLDLQPEEFRRALKALQDFSMVQYRAPRISDAPKNAVFIELSIMGRLFADLWRDMNNGLAKLMAERHIPSDALDAIAEG